MSNLDLNEVQPKWLKSRSAGVFAHVTSLPSETGIGNLGVSSYEFVDFLHKSGISFWQTCPLGPTGFGDSPYQTFSSSAGNPYLIDWMPLVECNLITHDELSVLYNLPSNFADYGKIYLEFHYVAKKAHQRFIQDPKILSEKYGDYQKFASNNEHWLHAYCLFQNYKFKFENLPWWEWPDSGHDAAQSQLNSEIYSYHEFLQYVFRGQWKRLREHANNLGIKLIGDLPIYCAPDSAEVWSFPELFKINSTDNSFTEIAGVPPDYFNSEGQLWGNPLYDWDKHALDQYSWWLSRLSDQLELFDVVRIDHFRGFHDYWSIPACSNDASKGKWLKGPGIEFWQIAKKRFPSLPFLAEDLGLISNEVRALRDTAELMGMAVLQFAFDGDPGNLYLAHNLSKSLVLYTGTHDNDTTNGWYENSSLEVKGNFNAYLCVSGSEPSWELIRHAYRTVSPLVMVPLQDLLGLGSEARFNKPGIAEGNWQWRMTYSQLDHLKNNISAYLYEQAKITGRVSFPKA